MTTQGILILVSSILVFLSYLIYEWSIVKGFTRPHRTTRFVLMLITVLGAAALFAQNDRVVVWFLGICAVQCVVVFIMSLKWGMGGWAKTDILCLVIALLGIALWKLTSNPALALYAAVTADIAGMVPALIKMYHLPHTEYYLSYAVDFGAIIFTLLAIQNGGFNEYLYPTYLIILSCLELFLIFRKQITKFFTSSKA